MSGCRKRKSDKAKHPRNKREFHKLAADKAAGKMHLINRLPDIKEADIIRSKGQSNCLDSQPELSSRSSSLSSLLPDYTPSFHPSGHAAPLYYNHLPASSSFSATPSWHNFQPNFIPASCGNASLPALYAPPSLPIGRGGSNYNQRYAPLMLCQGGHHCDSTATVTNLVQEDEVDKVDVVGEKLIYIAKRGGGASRESNGLLLMKVCVVVLKGISLH